MKEQSEQIEALLTAINKAKEQALAMRDSLPVEPDVRCFEWVGPRFERLGHSDLALVRFVNGKHAESWRFDGSPGPARGWSLGVCEQVGHWQGLPPADWPARADALAWARGSRWTLDDCGNVFEWRSKSEACRHREDGALGGWSTGASFSQYISLSGVNEISAADAAAILAEQAKAQKPAAITDEERMNWLASMDVEVRTPLVHGSRALFVAQCATSEEEPYRTSLREQVDAAMKVRPA